VKIMVVSSELAGDRTTVGFDEHKIRRYIKEQEQTPRNTLHRLWKNTAGWMTVC